MEKKLKEDNEVKRRTKKRQTIRYENQLPVEHVPGTQFQKSVGSSASVNE
jgi:hypothetical protein